MLLYSGLRLKTLLILTTLLSSITSVFSQQIYYFIDEGDTLAIEELDPTIFRTYDPDIPLHFEGPQTIWIHIELQANPTTEIIYMEVGGYSSADFIYDFEVFDQETGTIARAGSGLSQAELDFPENRFVVRVFPRARSAIPIKIKMNVLRLGTLSHFEVRPLTHDAALQARANWRIKNYTGYLVLTIFFSVLLLCFLLASYQYTIHREPAYGSYLIYLALLCVYYARGIEGPFGSVLSEYGAYGSLFRSFLSTVQYGTFAAYIWFVYHFLNIRQTTSRRLDLAFRGSTFLMLGLLLLDLMMMASGYDRIREDLFNGVRSVLFPLIFIVIIVIWKKFPSKLAYFILTGTLLMSLPACMTAIQHLGAGEGIFWESKPLYKVVFFTGTDLKIYMYQTRVGLIMEIICFLFGLLYRNSLVKADSPLLKQEIQSIVDPLLQRIENYVEENMAEGRITMDDLAKEMTMSRGHIHNKVKMATGKSTTAYINSIKLRRSLEMLQRTEKTIAEIAYEIGFSDPNYFTRVFTKQYGVSPKRMRGGDGSRAKNIQI